MPKLPIAFGHKTTGLTTSTTADHQNRCHPHSRLPTFIPMLAPACAPTSVPDEQHTFTFPLHQAILPKPVLTRDLSCNASNVIFICGTPPHSLTTSRCTSPAATSTRRALWEASYLKSTFSPSSWQSTGWWLQYRSTSPRPLNSTTAWIPTAAACPRFTITYPPGNTPPSSSRDPLLACPFPLWVVVARGGGRGVSVTSKPVIAPPLLIMLVRPMGAIAAPLRSVSGMTVTTVHAAPARPTSIPSWNLTRLRLSVLLQYRAQGTPAALSGNTPPTSPLRRACAAPPVGAWVVWWVWSATGA